MNDQDIINKKAQKIQLEIMDAVHSVCERNKLTYYIIGGTALGAVRHYGFIPWDVDIDIAMPRKDYELFIQHYSNLLEPKYQCKSYHNDSTHRSPHALVVKKGSRIIFNFDEFNPTGDAREVYIDIMPLDYPPSSIFKQYIQERSIKVIKKIRILKTAKVFAQDSFSKKIIKKLVQLLLFPISWKNINYCQDLAMKWFSNTDSGILCSMASHFKYKKQCFEKDVYGKPILYRFENKSFYGPAKMDYYLSRLYGNYMDFPSEESQRKLYYFIKNVQDNI